jgi:hypothetical protein
MCLSVTVKPDIKDALADYGMLHHGTNKKYSTPEVIVLCIAKTLSSRGASFSYNRIW